MMDQVAGQMASPDMKDESAEPLADMHPEDIPKSPARGVHLHSVLAYRGGAARIVNLLRQGLSDSGIPHTCSCEIDDAGPGNCSATCPSSVSPLIPVVASPAQLCRIVPRKHLLHLHGSQDWAACLSGIGALPSPCVITLHDCSLLTGGCPYPLDCPGIFEGCYDPCPRGFAQAHTIQQQRLQAVRAAGCSLVSPSRWLRRIARAVLPDVPCSVVPNGVEIPDGLLTRDLARHRLGITPGARVVLFMAHGGELAAYKSGDQWQRVWEGIRRQVDGALCFMVGGETHAHEGNLVRWPYVDRDNAQLLMAAADCFAYPTLADNHPLVVLEAMSLGCPVVAYETGGVSEQIQHGETGMLVPQGNWQAFSEACTSLLASSAMRRNLAMEGKARFMRHFTVQRMVSDYMRVYAGIC